MNYSEFSQVVNGEDKLLVKPARFFFLEPRLRCYVAEELSIAAVLHYDVEAEWGLNNFVHLNDMGVPHYFKNVDLACHSFDIIHLCDFVLFKNFNCNFLSCKKVNALFNFAKGSLAQSLGHFVGSDDFLKFVLRVFLYW